MRRRTLLLAAMLAAVAALPAAAADHPQAIDASTTIAFDHRGGNEWWVEVRVTTQAAHPDDAYISQVYARAESSPTWHALELKSWGNHAASFHIPPGDRVQFQAYRAGGMSDAWRVTSCYFTHPAGVEQCDEGSTGAFDATFSRPSGNEWWQQVYVTANRPIERVHLVRYTIDGEAWDPLTLRSWGAWAGSYHAPSGTPVKFVATSGGESDETGCYRWPDATPMACPPDDPPVRDPSRTTFDHKTGNEWWVEVLVGPYPPTRVLAQDEGGAWKELTLRSWGAWAGSFHVEPGHDVRFRALVDDDWYESCWFTHPQGVAPDGSQTCGSAWVGSG